MGARRYAMILTGALLAGCTASVKGEPLGKAFGAGYAAATRGSDSIRSSYTIHISNSSDQECGASTVAPKEGTQLLRVNIVKNGRDLPVARGAPYVDTGAEEWANVFGCVIQSGNCRLAELPGVTLNLTGASDAKVSGNFTANGLDGEPFSANFDAPLCHL